MKDEKDDQDGAIFRDRLLINRLRIIRTINRHLLNGIKSPDREIVPHVASIIRSVIEVDAVSRIRVLSQTPGMTWIDEYARHKASLLTAPRPSRICTNVRT